LQQIPFDFLFPEKIPGSKFCSGVDKQ